MTQALDDERGTQRVRTPSDSDSPQTISAGESAVFHSVAKMLVIHPAAGLFPPMTDAEYAALVDDIRTFGQREPILVLNGQVIDGRHRLRACSDLGREPVVQEADANADPLALVVSLNLHRRHLSDSQRAMIAARLATLPRGSNQHAQVCAPSQDAAADLVGVSRRTVQHARTVIDRGTPELVSAVDAGTVAVSTASELTRLPEEDQRALLLRTPDEIRSIARDIKDRIAAAGVTGPTAVKIFDRVAAEHYLSGPEQCAVIEEIKAQSPRLPTPAEADRIAVAGAPGLMVLATDGRYHTAPGNSDDNARMEQWLRLRDGLESLGTLPFDAATAFAAIPGYQRANVTTWLAHAVPLVHELNQLWNHDHA